MPILPDLVAYVLMGLFWENRWKIGIHDAMAQLPKEEKTKPAAFFGTAPIVPVSKFEQASDPATLPDETSVMRERKKEEICRDDVRRRAIYGTGAFLTELIGP